MEHDVVTFAKNQGSLQESRNALLVLFTKSNKRRSHSFVPSAASKCILEYELPVPFLLPPATSYRPNLSYFLAVSNRFEVQLCQ